MPLYEIAGSGLAHHAPAAFAALGLRERDDLQRLLRDDIGVLGDELLVIAEEFGEWEDARRRIDLLALDGEGHLVVIELKRTEDGGHMELQALRYAAMVSSMDFEDVVRAYAAHQAKLRPELDDDARASVVAFLGGGDDEEPVISSEVRIVLISADFGRELTTTVLWLNRFDGLDIRCVQLVPYHVDGRVLLDIRQIVPLPEAADYQVRVRRKAQRTERARSDARDFTRYHVVVDGRELPDENKRKSMRLMVTNLVERGESPAAISAVLPPSHFKSVGGVFADAEALSTALQAEHPHFDPGRWYLEDAFAEDGRTWVLSRMWGRDTEARLAALSEAFPDARVTYRRADG
jgi:hypothetical protein